MNANSQAIVIFCSQLCITEGINPLKPSEWSGLAEKLMARRLEPRNLLNFSAHSFMSELGLSEEYAQRLLRLTDRSAGLFAELHRYAAEGISVYTRADHAYPLQLKRKLGQKCPPLFYCAGDMQILGLRVVGFTGPQEIDDDDSRFTRRAVRKTCARRLGVASGGGEGAESLVVQTALTEGWPVIEYIAGGLSALIRRKDVKDSIASGRRLVLSEAIPGADFDSECAVSVSRYIYAQSEAAVVVRAEMKDSVTWSGAAENLKNKYCPLFCRDTSSEGSMALISMGAVPIGNDWDGDITRPYIRPGQMEIPYPM